MADRPNVLFILADQFRGDCVGADPRTLTDQSDSPLVQTPTLDNLARRGTLFSTAYTPNPVCVPARRCLWTGQTPVVNGCTMGNTSEPWTFDHTIPGELGDAGYQTRLVGKTHSQPLNRGSNHYTGFGFDEMVTHIGSSVWEDDYGEWLRGRGGDDRRGTGLSHQPEDARPWHRDEAEHPTNWTTRQALEFLERRDHSRPFFLTVSYVRPHAPLDPPQMYWNQYINRDLPPPVVGDWVREKFEALEKTPWIRKESESHVRQCQVGYYGLITHLDHHIHRLLYALEWQHDILDETIVIFTSDHGEMLGDHLHWAKTVPYEPSVRIPLIVDVPEWVGSVKQSSGIVNQPVGLEDVMPTLLELSDVSIPETVKGESLTPLLEDSNMSFERSYYHGENGSTPASHYLVDDETKYVWFPETGEDLLFDLGTDHRERTDVSGTEEHAPELEIWRNRMINQLKGRDEGFVVDGELRSTGNDTSS